MQDVDIVGRIGELADEEHRVERAHQGDPLSEADTERLRSIEVPPRQRSWSPGS